MKCKVRMTHTIEFFVEGKSEDRILDWLYNITPEEARKLMVKFFYEDYTEEIKSVAHYYINDFTWLLNL